MMKKIILGVTLILCLLISSGCESQEKDTPKKTSNNVSQKIEDSNLDELKNIVADNIKKIEELEKELKNKQQENEELKKEITNLQTQLDEFNEKDTILNNSIDSKYNELKGLIGNNTATTTTSSNYIISKSQLIGTWKNINYDETLIFTEENSQVLGNWIIYYYNNREMAFSYIYKDGKLYISENGATFIKQ